MVLVFAHFRKPGARARFHRQAASAGLRRTKAREMVSARSARTTAHCLDTIIAVTSIGFSSYTPAGDREDLSRDTGDPSALKIDRWPLYSMHTTRFRISHYAHGRMNRFGSILQPLV